jgi:hypothetical protein
MQTADPHMAALFLQAAGGDAQRASLLMAITGQESGFDPKALNPISGAEGLGQFMPSTVKWLEQQKGSPFYRKTFDPYNAQQSAVAENYYIGYLLKKYHGNENAALNDYSGGAGAGYYTSVEKAQQSIDVQLTGTLVVNDPNGRQIGTVTIPKTHVDTKARPGHTSHGPDPVGMGGSRGRHA